MTERKKNRLASGLEPAVNQAPAGSYLFHQFLARVNVSLLSFTFASPTVLLTQFNFSTKLYLGLYRIWLLWVYPTQLRRHRPLWVYPTQLRRHRLRCQPTSLLLCIIRSLLSRVLYRHHFHFISGSFTPITYTCQLNLSNEFID